MVGGNRKLQTEIIVWFYQIWEHAKWGGGLPWLPCSNIPCFHMQILYPTQTRGRSDGADHGLGPYKYVGQEVGHFWPVAMAETWEVISV